MNYSQLSVLLC